MFGWEFPPNIAGGLGTACYGLTKGLAKNGVDILFVMPAASGKEDQSAVKIINASDVEIEEMISRTHSGSQVKGGVLQRQTPFLRGLIS